MKVDLNQLFNKNKDLDERATNALLKSLVGAHTSNEFEYLKFKQSLESLQGMNMDKATAIKSAFATASTMGLTKDKLIRSAERYLSVLSNESVTFSDALKSQIDKHVNSRESVISKIEGKIKENKSKIEELQKEIQLLEQKMETVDDDIEAAQTRIEEAKQKFKKSYLTITDVIKGDVEEIKQYL